MEGLEPSARRIVLDEEVRVARIEHWCSNDPPECMEPRIFPGDQYLRVVLLVLYQRTDGTSCRAIRIEKYHLHPGCPHDPERDQSEMLSAEVPLAAAA